MNFARFTFLALAMGVTLQYAQAQTAAPRMINRDELRACMDSESQIAARREAADARSKAQVAEHSAIRTEREAIQAEHKRVEEGSGSRDRLERRVRVFNDRLKAANDVQAQISAELDSIGKALGEHNARCSGTAYKDEDKEAILKERAAAGKK